MNKYWLALILSFITLGWVHSQSLTQIKSLADKYYQNGSFLEAADFYERLSEIQPKNTEFQLRLADCLLKSHQYDKATEQFNHLLSRSFDPEVYYHYGYLLKMKAEYKKADSIFTLVINSAQGQDDLVELATLQQRGCKLGIRQQKLNKSKLTEIEWGLNSGNHDFGLIELNDEQVVLSSSRRSGSQYFDNQIGGLLPNIISYKRIDTTWIRVSDFKNLNSPMGEAAGCFSPDGAFFYFTSCQGNQPCKIMVSKRGDEGWGSAEPMPIEINAPDFDSKHPFLSKTGDTLFYASNRPGGQGGMDIWMTIDFGRVWSPPINLGGTINTTADEISPFYSSKFEAVLFSSNGHASYGGHDVYLAKGKSFFAPKIFNIGGSYNSPLDDSFFKMANGKGSISSNRNTKDFNIYAFEYDDEVTFLQSLMTDEGLVDLIHLNALSFDLHAFRAEEYARYQLLQPRRLEVVSSKVVDNLDNQLRLYGEGTPASTIRLAINDSLEMLTYVTDQGSFEIRLIADSLRNSPLTANGQVVPAKIGKMDFDGSQFEYEKIYFDFSSSKLRDESKESLRDLVRSFRIDNIVMVDIHTHTDQIGNYDFNYKLSEDRGLEIIKFLSELGLSYHQLRVFPNGEKNLISKKDTWYSRLFNRRAEIVVYTESPVSYILPEIFLTRKSSSLADMAKSFGITERKIRDWNGLSESQAQLPEGHVVRVFDPNHLVPNYSLFIPEKDIGKQLIPYVVKPGETVRMIADKFGIVEEVIMETNHLTEEVSTGMELVIFKY